MFNNCNTGFSMPVVPAGYGYGYGGGSGGFGGGFGNDWIGLIVILALLGWGGNGFGGGFGGGGNRGFGLIEPWATQSDVRDAVDNQTLISKLDQQTYGIADSFTALNNAINSNFRGVDANFRTVDNAICNLGFQTQQGFNNASAQLAQCLKKIFTFSKAVGTCAA